MGTRLDVAVLIGSLRRDSYSRRLASSLEVLAPASLKLFPVDFRNLPLFDQDLEESESEPTEWTRFRESVRGSDAVLFVTPEYNRSIPGGLKNAIDVGSRPFGASVWDSKPAAVASVSPGAMGGFGANHHLRQSLVFLNAPTMPQPEVYLGGASSLFAGDGALINGRTADFLSGFLVAFERWIRRFQSD
jgi:chromate reductase